MKQRILWMLLSFLLVLALVLASCGPTVPEEELELRVGVGSLGSELDPHKDDTIHRLNFHMYDILFSKETQLTRAGEPLRPGVVEKWELAPDGLSWTFHLRDDVIFHDGSKLTAEDVKFSYERICEDWAEYFLTWREQLGEPCHIEVLDDYTLRIYTNGPRPDFIARSNMQVCILPKAYIEEKGSAYFERHPIGSGPYKFVRFVPGDLIECEVVDYDHWSGVVPEFERVIVYEIPEETTRAFMVEKGTLDVAEVSMKSAFALQEKGEGFTPAKQLSAVIQFWCVAPYHPLAEGTPLADVRVREALSIAINRQEIMDTMFYGLADFPGPPRMSWNEPLQAFWSPETMAKWQAWCEEGYRYDPEEARRLIAEAGYGDGFSFDFWNIPDEEAPYIADVVTACAGYFAEVGAHANVIPVDKAYWKSVRHTVRSTEPVGKMTVDGSNYPKASTIHCYSLWTSDKGYTDEFVGHPDQAEYDELFIACASEMDETKRAGMLDQMMEMVCPSWTCIPVLNSPAMYIFGPRVDPNAPLSLQPIWPVANTYPHLKYTGIERE